MVLYSLGSCTFIWFISLEIVCHFLHTSSSSLGIINEAIFSCWDTVTDSAKRHFIKDHHHQYWSLVCQNELWSKRSNNLFSQKIQWEWNFVKMLEKSHVILKNIQEFLHSHGFNQHIISESWGWKKNPWKNLLIFWVVFLLSVMECNRDLTLRSFLGH